MSEQPADRPADPEAVARTICLQRLTERARTRHELADLLRKRSIPDEVAEKVLNRLVEVGLVDDAALAEQWVRTRHARRGLASRALAGELRRKGVADEVVGDALTGLDHDAEELRARELVDRRLRSMAAVSAGTDVAADAAAVRRLVGMLARKGYSQGLAYQVVRAALAERGSEIAEQLDALELSDG